MDAETIAYVCSDNRDAIRLCESWLAHCHLWDDVIDGESAGLSAEKLVAMQHGWQLELIANPFFLQHRLALVPVIEAAYSAWLDSNDWQATGTNNQQFAAHVLKGHWHEVIFYCARLTGGWAHYREVCREYRDYDFECTDFEVAPDAANRLLNEQLNTGTN